MTAKFPLLVPGKPACLKMFLGEVDAQLKRATASKMEVSARERTEITTSCTGNLGLEKNSALDSRSQKSQQVLNPLGIGGVWGVALSAAVLHGDCFPN